MTGPLEAAGPVPGYDGRQFARSLPGSPGVYRMLDAAGDVLYVGKANALDKRVGSYFSGRSHAPRIASMLRKVARMEVTLKPGQSKGIDPTDLKTWA